MKTVQPIRDDRIIDGMKHYFRVRSMRNYLFFCIGIYSGLRVSDLLTLRVGEARRSHVSKMEQKNKNSKRFIIHPSIRDDLDIYIADKADDEYLFASRQKKTISQLENQPIDRSTAYRFLNEAAEHFGLQEIGNHTLRKTWGYRLYRQDENNLALLMDAFGHSDMRVTLRYIGLTQDLLDRATLRMR
jgi:integrase